MHHRRRLLTISHSYVVALNRRLAHEMARAGADRWEVTAAAPSFFHGDLRSIRLEREREEANELLPLAAHLTHKAHFFFYGPELYPALRRGWDLVHAWEEPFVVAGAQLAHGTPRGVPLVFATYQNLEKRYPPPFRQLEAYVLRRASGWIAGGVTVTRAHAARRDYQRLPVETIPLGVDVEHFRPAPEAGARVREALGWSPEGPPVVGYLGRFNREKGVQMLQRVLERSATPWRALFVGGGPLEAELRAWGARQGDRVRVVTGVPHDGVPSHLNAMDVLCAPSQTTPVWSEQLGRMLL
jgi:phosphatidylinositol alpha-1,6-mannosyltransferase